MANPAVLQVDTVLYAAAEPEGRLFPAGSPWPGDAWSANRGGEPVGKGATAQAMKDLIAAQDTIDNLAAQLAAKDHDLAVMAAERDAANGKVGAGEQRAIDAEKAQVEAEASAKGYMTERDAARADLKAAADKLGAAQAEADKVPGLVAQMEAANQALADATAAATAPAKAPKAPKTPAAAPAEGGKAPDPT